MLEQPLLVFLVVFQGLHNYIGVADLLAAQLE